MVARRNLWTLEEDAQLKSIMKSYNKPMWKFVALKMHTNRSGKQCRERWLDHINPNIIHTPWTQKEKDLIFNAHRIYGNKWNKIALLLPGRTSASVKNLWYSSKRNVKEKFKEEIKYEPRSERFTSELHNLDDIEDLGMIAGYTLSEEDYDYLEEMLL